MFDKFSLDALKESRKALDNAHMAPPIEAFVRAAVPLIRELLDDAIAAKTPAVDPVDPKSGGAAKK